MSMCCCASGPTATSQHVTRVLKKVLIQAAGGLSEFVINIIKRPLVGYVRPPSKDATVTSLVEIEVDVAVPEGYLPGSEAACISSLRTLAELGLLLHPAAPFLTSFLMMTTAMILLVLRRQQCIFCCCYRTGSIAAAAVSAAFASAPRLP